MSLSFIKTAIDREQPNLGDVVIVKHTFFDPGVEGQLVTVCTDCGKRFPTQFRRMGKVGTARACEVRNVPQCPKCRAKYRKAKAQVEAFKGFRPGDRVRYVGGGAMAASVGTLATVRDPANENGYLSLAWDVEGRNGQMDGGYYPEHFELVEKPIKDGERVFCDLAPDYAHSCDRDCMNPRRAPEVK
jgi:hypothetical protein